MEERQHLVNLLSTNFGIDLYPKSDGRVEIPKHIISSVGWDSLELVYMSSDMYENIYISSDCSLLDIAEGEVAASVAVSHGRLRIPAGFLKKIGLLNRNLVAVSDMSGTLYIKPDNSNSGDALVEIINNLNEDVVKQLSKALSGLTENYIPNMELVRVSVNQSELPLAELFMLEGNENSSFVFRPINNPYKFKCCWVDKVPLISKSDNEHTATLYLIPGIKRIKKDKGGGIPGFLIIDETTFGKICYIIKKK